MAMAAVPSIEDDVVVPPHPAPKHASALTPPTSEDLDKHNDASSDLSELEDLDDKPEPDADAADDDDIGDVEPDHYYGDGKIPVFKPTMDQFRSFAKFVEKVDKYGMKSGIIKVIPPKEWRDSLPALDDAVKTIKVKNPITQEFVGTHGTYTQQNIEKQRSYNLPQWKALTEESNHQPPAKRGERRRNLDAVKPKPRTSAPLAPGEKRKPGRPRRNAAPQKEDVDLDVARADVPDVPPTPTSPEDRATGADADAAGTNAGGQTDTTPAKKRGKAGRPRKSSPKPKGRQPKATTVAERRKYNITSTADDVDEESFRDFDYRFPEAAEFTAERCQELEDVYWKTLNYGTPMYGADMPGSLFDDNCHSWHVGRLENLLDVLGTKVPGVNTTYLYLGMWKATFAWHLEDVDLYSINYIHFGAPKQWYSISQEDARRFEAAMKTIWPTDAKHCDQFLRHKTYLISPEKLKSQFNIKVNKLVHNEGEFVITYPYGYHSGFNLGYNCAESVNFATESWLNYGRIAKKCNCEADSVWVDVAEIERKMRGEPTPEYYEETDDDEDDSGVAQLATPPPSGPKKGRGGGGKRKRDSKVQPGPKKTKKIRILVKIPSKMPCILCPNDATYDTLLSTDNGQKAHRLCALYTPETYISEHEGKEMIRNVAGIDKSRLDLKCIFCRSKRGSCFQCSEKKCTRAYHATCAIGAGVQIDTGPVPTWDAEGTEFWCEGFDFRCRFHRPKRAKHTTVEALEGNKAVRSFARSLKVNDTVQAQYFGSDAFGGVVLENRPEEQSVLVKVLPDGDTVEIEWKWILVLDPADSKRPKPSPDAKKLPDTLLHDSAINTDNRKDGVPEIGEPFLDPNSGHKWEEWNAAHWREVQNPFQKQVDFGAPERLWHYLGKTSTEAKAQFTHDLAKAVHNPKSNFLDTVRPAPRPPGGMADRRVFPVNYPTGANFHALNAAMSAHRQYQQHRPLQQAPARMERPYEYKPKVLMASTPNPKQQPTATGQPPSYGPTTNRGPINLQPAQPGHGKQDTHPPSMTAPKPYQQPPSIQAVATDPLRAGYPYQTSTYTQVHGPQSPVDPNFANLLAKSRGSSPGSVGHHRIPSLSSQRPPSQHQASAPIANMHDRPPSSSTTAARNGGPAGAPQSGKASLSMPSADSPYATTGYNPQWAPKPMTAEGQTQSPYASQGPYSRPPPAAAGGQAPMAPMMGGALPGQAGYQGSYPQQQQQSSYKPQAQHATPQQFQNQVNYEVPAAFAEQNGQSKQFDHLKHLLGNYHHPYSHAQSPAAGASQGTYGPSPPHSERAYTATPPSKHTHNQGPDPWGAPSPARPEYSPLSEAEGPAREQQDPRAQLWK